MRDRMMNARPRAVAQGAHAVISRLQNAPAHIQVAAAAAVFMELTTHYKIRPSDAITAAGNMMERHGEITPEFRALRLYIKNELPR